MERLELRLLNPTLVFTSIDDNKSEDRFFELTKLVEFIEHGEYLQTITFFENSSLCLSNLLHLVESENNPFYHIHDLIMDYLCEGDFEEGSELMFVLLLAVAYLHVYVQCNYTGPELTNTQHSQLALSEESHMSRVLNHLEYDGSFPYKRIEVPHALLIARILLSYVTDPYRASWREHVQLDGQSRIVLPSKSEEHRERLACLPLLHTPTSAYWWGARALVLQMRALHEKAFEQLPALWLEVKQTISS
ncbi:hypothetical protein EON63_16575 [archaeon]|nr:MAG: hypothetical protein EON63_16575 [archaeon]